MQQARIASWPGLLIVIVVAVLGVLAGANLANRPQQSAGPATSLQVQTNAAQTNDQGQVATPTLRQSSPVASVVVSSPTEATPSLPYAANWTSGLGGWAGPSSWKAAGGKLLSSGGPYSQYQPIWAPVDLGSTADYAVEARIRVVKNGSSFGIIVRSDGDKAGYAAGVGIWSGSGSGTGINLLDGWWGTNDMKGRIADGHPFDPGTSWHTYRVETRGNTVTLRIDGSVFAKATDNTFLEPGQVGLWCNAYQLEVQSFTVSAL